MGARLHLTTGDTHQAITNIWPTHRNGPLPFSNHKEPNHAYSPNQP
jgi:hypothetical protein